MEQSGRTLAQLRVRPGRAEPVFAGEAARFTLLLANAGAFDRPEILVRHQGAGAHCTVDVAPSDTAQAVLAVPAERRGWVALGRGMLETRLSLGPFRAPRYLQPHSPRLVLSRPQVPALPPPTARGPARRPR